ncbi:hypothetical protein T02_3974 [Trichinella nativa]|uniref:Uncharacterized protein n=1 Tax=Trichinella nativa TaxID=6335 RepID=A0A0V1KMN0_9BILA|nr:hypothetical protein T02_3974 [Trichinella nativa]
MGKYEDEQPQALPSGYAPGQIKICIFPQAIPQAIYSTIFVLRAVLCKFLIASGQYANFYLPSGYAWGYASGNFLKISKFFEI